MKKFVSLLAAMFVLSASSMSAADETSTTTKNVTVATTPTAASELQGGYFVIKAAAKGVTGRCVYYSGNSAITATTGSCFKTSVNTINTDTIGDGGSLAYVWYVSKSADGKMLFIQNAGNGAYFPAQNGRGQNFSVSKALSNAATYYYSDPYDDKGVLLYQTKYTFNGAPLYIHSNGADNNGNVENVLSYWENYSNVGTSGSATLFTFYKAELSDAVTSSADLTKQIVTVKQQLDGVDTGVSTTSLGTTGEAATNPWTSHNYFLTPTITPETITAGQDVTVNFVTGTSPVTFSTADKTTYYSMKVRGAGEKWVVAYNNQIATNQDALVLSNNTTYDFARKYVPAAFWSFEKSGVGVKIRAGNGKYINVGGTGNTATLSDNGSVFYFKGAPSNANSSNFALQYAEDCYLGDHSGGNTRIGTWTSASNPGAANDKGSGYTIKSTCVLEDLKTALVNRLTSFTQPTTTPDVNMLRVATAENVASAKTAAESATNLETLINAYNTAFTTTFDADAYYRIVNANIGLTNRYLSSEEVFVGTDGTLNSAYTADNSINRTVKRLTANGNLSAQLWRFEDAGSGTYLVRNANTNCNLSAADSNVDLPVSTSNGGKYRILAVPTSAQTASVESGHAINSINNGVSTFLVIRDGHQLNAAAGNNGTTIGNWDNHEDDASNYWTFVKVTEIPVAISAAKFATVGFPFNTKVTTEGVKVFYAKQAENGTVTLTEIEDKVIPANEGAILYNEDGATTATLQITTTGGTLSDNVLTATAAGRTGFTTLTTYGLALNSSNEACFMKNSLTTVPANKAYLSADNYTEATGSAQMLRFSFDGGSMTGIDNTVAEDGTPVEYFDLQGRRVLYPAHGIFVTSKGEKVLIK